MKRSKKKRLIWIWIMETTFSKLLYWIILSGVQIKLECSNLSFSQKQVQLTFCKFNWCFSSAAETLCVVFKTNPSIKNAETLRDVDVCQVDIIFCELLVIKFSVHHKCVQSRCFDGFLGVWLIHLERERKRKDESSSWGWRF